MPDDHGPLTWKEITLIREIFDTQVKGLKELLLAEIQASRQAVAEADKALKEYKIQVNEWPVTFNEYSKAKADKLELTPIRRDIEKCFEEIAGLRESRAGGNVKDLREDKNHETLLVYIGIAVAVLLGVVNLLKG